MCCGLHKNKSETKDEMCKDSKIPFYFGNVSQLVIFRVEDVHFQLKVRFQILVENGGS